MIKRCRLDLIIYKCQTCKFNSSNSLVELNCESILREKKKKRIKIIFSYVIDIKNLNVNLLCVCSKVSNLKKKILKINSASSSVFLRVEQESFAHFTSVIFDQVIAIINASSSYSLIKRGPWFFADFRWKT